MTTITKKELTDRIAQLTQQKRGTVKRTLQLFLDLVVEELAKGNRLEFREFGVFEVKERAPRTAQNPKTLQRVQVPAKKTVKFKVGRIMRERMDGAAGGSGNGEARSASARTVGKNDGHPSVEIKTRRGAGAGV
jgi:integration host factor subunit beta